MGYFFPALEIFATLNVREDKGMEISPIRKCFDEEEFVESVKNWAKATVERGVAVNCKAADRPRLPKGFVRLSRLATCHIDAYLESRRKRDEKCVFAKKVCIELRPSLISLFLRHIQTGGSVKELQKKRSGQKTGVG